MINVITLKFGKNASNPPETLNTTPITVFVGPNNSGKSLALSEINSFCRSADMADAKIIQDITFVESPPDTIEEKINQVKLPNTPGQVANPGHFFVGIHTPVQQVTAENLRDYLSNPNASKRNFCRYYLSFSLLKLNGEGRIKLTQQQNGGDLQKPPQTSFQVLFRDDDKRDEVRRIVFDALGEHLVIDPTDMGSLRLRLSATAPPSKETEQGLHKEATLFHGKATLIEHASDGAKAFVGIISEIVAGDPKILMIDEPEAFLHPALSFKLGKEIALSTVGSEKRMFVSTHSANFVMGCIQSGVPVNIVRLTYRQGNASARILTADDLLPFMRNPLLRSTGVFNALFYEFVVVTESDADRAFYQEINERLNELGQGIPNCLFLNAQNKQTVKTIVRPLREIGIPVAGIVDVDVIKDGGNVWTGFMDSFFFPTIEKSSIATLRTGICAEFKKVGGNMKKDGGIDLLEKEDREGAENFFDKLSEHGLFVVRKGELESWLSELSVEGHGPDWLIKIFERMGDDPQDTNYVRAGNDDVWKFLKEVRMWMVNPERKGIPT